MRGCDNVLYLSAMNPIKDFKKRELIIYSTRNSVKGLLYVTDAMDITFRLVEKIVASIHNVGTGVSTSFNY